MFLSTGLADEDMQALVFLSGEFGSMLVASSSLCVSMMLSCSNEFGYLLEFAVARLQGFEIRFVIMLVIVW